MTGPTFTVPPQILDMLAKGLREMEDRPPSIIRSERGEVREVMLKTDAGDLLTFQRGLEMERT